MYVPRILKIPNHLIFLKSQFETKNGSVLMNYKVGDLRTGVGKIRRAQITHLAYAYKVVEPVLDRCPIVDIFPFHID